MKFFFISIFLILTTISSSSYSKEEKGIINSFLKEELEDFELSKEKQNISDLIFKDHQEKEISFSEFRGKVLLVNFWATWCAPCIKEMPSLDRLKSKFEKNFDVIAISLDRDGKKKVTDFFNENKIINLEKFFDNKKFVFIKNNNIEASEGEININRFRGIFENF